MRALLLLAALALLPLLAALLDPPTSVVVGIVDAGTCGYFQYNYTTNAVRGLIHIDEAEFYSLGAGRSNAISVQLNVHIISRDAKYWAQNVLIITEINNTYYLTVADYLFNLSDLETIRATGRGITSKYFDNGRTIAYYQSSETLGPITYPVTLGLEIYAENSTVVFSYYLGGWHVYDAVELGDGPLKIYVAPGSDAEWVIAGPREGYTAYIERWEGWSSLYYRYGGSWYQPPCAYSGSLEASTAERVSPVYGLSEYADGDGLVVQIAGRSSVDLLWAPSLWLDETSQGTLLVLTPPQGRWLINGSSASAGQILKPGVYFIELYAGNSTVYSRYVSTR
ncbi:thermopsin family protease [Thermoproteus tenax]|uniref:Thermopsine related protein n=1 Tax=Thermoproteus tenax (strain ATCC 35583 / DSM 2078 / JCM 9277 / NBRC 100435 / Kra 1) TaxID=768679 RepID=G4RQ69_THETK|nr:thermopsin family protease [Thermoproteus tenax]CCC80706.1 Thermopsine precursor related protein [Thermoproteus tenax Kra 1]